MSLDSSVMETALERLNLLKSAKYSYNRIRYALNFPLRKRNLAFHRRGAPDGLPLPPAKLTFLVRWRYDLQDYYESGALGHACIVNALKATGFEPERLGSILDFGCGCARVLRHWRLVAGQRLYGADYNPELLAWCAKSLPFATFVNNELSGQIDLPDATFDLIYASSVFTHFDAELQDLWLTELGRLLKPKGLLLITVMGETRLPQLSEADRAAFIEGKLVIQNQRYIGTNVCGAFHPYAYVVHHLAKGWRILAFQPGGAKDQNQDIYLLQK